MADEETTVERLRQEIETKHTDDRLGAQYRQGVINPIELAKLMGCRPQAVYADIRAGRLKAIKLNSTQKLVLQRDEALGYAAAYLDRKAAREEAKSAGTQA